MAHWLEIPNKFSIRLMHYEENEMDLSLDVALTPRDFEWFTLKVTDFLSHGKETGLSKVPGISRNKWNKLRISNFY